VFRVCCHLVPSSDGIGYFRVDTAVCPRCVSVSLWSREHWSNWHYWVAWTASLMTFKTCSLFWQQTVQHFFFLKHCAKRHSWYNSQRNLILLIKIVLNEPVYTKLTHVMNIASCHNAIRIFIVNTAVISRCMCIPARCPFEWLCPSVRHISPAHTPTEI